jgi:hypothetical protein
MTDPTRLLDESGDEFERLLLSSGVRDAGSSRALNRAVAAFSAAAALSAGPAVASAASGVVGSGLLLAKWFGAGALAGTVAVSAASAVRVMGGPSAPPAAVLVSAPKPSVVEPQAVERQAPNPTQEPVPTGKPRGSESRATETAPSDSLRASRLSAELAELQRAREALDRGDLGAARAALERHARAFPEPRLGPEATVLRARLEKKSEATPSQ